MHDIQVLLKAQEEHVRPVGKFADKDGNVLTHTKDSDDDGGSTWKLESYDKVLPQASLFRRHLAAAVARDNATLSTSTTTTMRCPRSSCT